MKYINVCGISPFVESLAQYPVTAFKIFYLTAQGDEFHNFHGILVTLSCKGILIFTFLPHYISSRNPSFAIME
jgi:hypothetical protein